MGESNRRRRAHAAILAREPGCIYCAGKNVATTIEHMPPISIFEGKQRPKGLEFPACDGCNHGTSHSDLVAAMLARFWPDARTDLQERDIIRLLAAVRNNIPEVLREMDMGRGAEKIARKRPNMPADAHLLRADGPVLTKHLLTFSAKLGFALHFDIRGTPVPESGGVMPMWFSNYQALNGEIPPILFSMLPSAPKTLQQGSKSVGSQFLYSYATGEAGHTLYFAAFSQSFAVAGITALDRSIFLESYDGSHPVMVPGTF